MKLENLKKNPGQASVQFTRYLRLKMKLTATAKKKPAKAHALPEVESLSEQFAMVPARQELTRDWRPSRSRLSNAPACDDDADDVADVAEALKADRSTYVPGNDVGRKYGLPALT
jgi:hypothetical protein